MIFRLALAQINPSVGDLRGNSKLIVDQIEQARSQGAQLVVFPELSLTGYPPEDLLLKPDFLRASRQALEGVAAAIGQHAHVQPGDMTVVADIWSQPTAD